MKKTLLALAAIAASSAAFAQSSVSLYGVVDASVESIKGNDTTVSRVSSDNLAISRLGFKGTEDLGGGLKANFVLETAIKADTGSNGNLSSSGSTVRFFDRAAWAGLAGGFGELRLGRQDSSAGLLAGNTSLLGAQAYDDLKIAKTYAGADYRRLDNAVTYLLPTLVKGLSAQVQYSTAAGTSGATGTETYGNDQGKTWGFNVAYAADGVVAGVGYVNGKFNPAGSVKDTGVLAYAGYDFAVAKLTGYYNMDKQTDAAEIRRLIGVRLDVPVSKEFAVQASVSKVKNTTLATRGDDDNATIVAMKGVYSLSKRTAVYGLFTNVNNSDNANLVVSGATAGFGKTSRGLAVGVSHKF